MTPLPTIEHQRIRRELMLALGNYLEKEKAGELFVASTGLQTSTGDILEPDIQVILTERKEIIKTNYIKGPPHIVVEIISLGTQHRD